MNDLLAMQAEVNFVNLGKNQYPGRGLIVGVSEDGTNLIQVYWLTGRRAKSKNRILESGINGSLRAAPISPDKSNGTGLEYYDAMLEFSRDDEDLRKNLFIVSNGDQTNTVFNFLKAGSSFENALLTREHEPDEPIFTPRISALCNLINTTTPLLSLSIIRKSKVGFGSDHAFWFFKDCWQGYGYGLTTYKDDGNPPPTYEGEPKLLPLKGGIERVAQIYWSTLNKEHRVSLAVKFIKIGNGESELHIINNLS